LALALLLLLVLLLVLVPALLAPEEPGHRPEPSALQVPQKSEDLLTRQGELGLVPPDSDAGTVHAAVDDLGPAPPARIDAAVLRRPLSVGAPGERLVEAIPVGRDLRRARLRRQNGGAGESSSGEEKTGSKHGCFHSLRQPPVEVAG